MFSCGLSPGKLRIKVAKMSLIKGVALGILLVSVALLSDMIRPQNYLSDNYKSTNLESDIPKKFGEWYVDENDITMVTSPDLEANVASIYDQVLNRTYVNSQNRKVFLTITYGKTQVGKKKAHRQEVCYAAQGFIIESLSTKNISLKDRLIPVVSMSAVKSRYTEEVTYWFTLGENVVLDKVKRFLVQAKYSFQGQIPDGFLVRVSTRSGSNDDFNLHQEFIEELLNNIDEDYLPRLIGA